jgi:tetratricopeptide (TPR) repeat protein
VLLVLIAATQLSTRTYGENQAPDWQLQVRQFAATGDWKSAMALVDQEIARAPQDMDVRAWRARVLAWSGQFAKAENEYRRILKVSRKDPDMWMGLAGACLAEGKIEDARRAVDAAEELDPTRADLHAERARILRAAGERSEAQSEFQAALDLDPRSEEARAGLASVRPEARNELRFGQDNDLLNYTSDYGGEWLNLVSRWTSRWSTSVAGDFYQRSGVGAGKFVGSLTRRQPKWGALTVGGAIGHDHAVIPKSEAFFDLDHGFSTSETGFVRSVELDYAQHWYWYQSSRILTLTGTGIVYMPREWTFTLATTGARNAFSGTGAEWRPSELGRLGFPLAHQAEKQLSGNVFFAAGTEDFAQVDQIGRFASQTYGGGLKFQITARQDVAGYAAYQKRTQGKTDASFGLSYGIHF